MKQTTQSLPHIVSDGKSVEVHLVTKLDTIYKDRFITNTVYVPVPNPTHIDTIYIEGTSEVATIPAIKRVYKDTTEILKDVKVGYTAKVTGTLDDMSLSIMDTRPEKIVERTTTITEIVYPKGLYLGIQGNLGLTELAPSIQYLNNKNIYGIKYNVANPNGQGIQNIGVTYARRIL